MLSTPAYYRARQYRVIGAVVCLLLTAVIAFTSLFTVRGQNLDTLAMEALIQRAHVVPEHLRNVIAFDSVPVFAVGCVLAALIAIVRRRFALGVRAVIVVCGSNLMVQLVKLALVRPFLGVGVALDNSFPSGHTAFAASIAAALVLVAPRGLRAIFAFFGGIGAALVGQVVMVQGWHRPSDVAGAMLIVAAWTLVLAPVEQGERFFPTLQRFVGFMGWALLVIASLAWGAAVVRLWPDLALPLSTNEISSWSNTGIRTGQWLAGASLLFPLGIEGAVLSSVSRLRGDKHSRLL